jgi:uncharacterized protein (DUF427 family)
VIDGKRHERAAWNYEAPQPRMKQVTGRFGYREERQGRRKRETSAAGSSRWTR